MKYPYPFLCLILILTSGVHSQDAFIRNVNVLTMTEEGMVRGQDLLIRDGTIASITPTGTLGAPADIVIVQGDNHYLLPGLSEMHAHIPVAEGDNDTLVREAMMLYLAKGVTVIRGMLGNPYHLKFRDDANSGRILAPRVYTSSPSMNGNSVPDINTAREKVIAAKEDGYDFLKIHPGITLPVMQALVRTANEVGIDYAGHVPAEVGIRRALQFGYKTVDHVDGYIEGLVDQEGPIDPARGGFFGLNLVDQLDWSRMPDLAQLTLDQNTWIVPTQSLFTRWISPTGAEEMMAADEMSYMPASTRYAWATNKSRLLNDPEYSADQVKKFVAARQKILLALHEKGVPFLLGSDSPQVMNVPGFSIHHEIKSLVESGIPIETILASGTVNVARFFDEQGTYGQISVGADADLILVEDNPLEHYETLSNPLGTFRMGQWLNREFFKSALAQIAARHRVED